MTWHPFGGAQPILHTQFFYANVTQKRAKSEQEVSRNRARSEPNVTRK